jgi:uncharacterized protein involved in cysteine biosynthesis
MIAAFWRAFTQLGDARIVRYLLLAVVLSLLSFAALWSGVAWFLASTTLTDWRFLDTTLGVLGGLATLLVTWFLFPIVLSGTIGLFLEAAAAAVEARHYPELPTAKGIAVWPMLRVTLRFLCVAVLLNLLLLPFLLLGPLFPVVYYVVNGYLLGRGYAELVLLRRLDPVAASALRRRNRGAMLFAGILTAMMLTVPLLNLLAPVLAVMAMVHLCNDWQRPAFR